MTPPTLTPILFLHGLMGGTENWTPMLPFLPSAIPTTCLAFPFFAPERPVSSVPEAVALVEAHLDAQRIDRCVLCGNSFGGHVALDVALHRPEQVAGLVLSGSSGLFEKGFTTIPGTRPPREWVIEKIKEVFYDPIHVTDALVDEVIAIVSDREFKGRQLLKLAKSAKKDNVAERLGQIACPTLLIWGRNDNITPLDTAEEFRGHIPAAELAIIDQCGHAPMMEHPRAFAETLAAWYDRVVLGAAPLATR